MKIKDPYVSIVIPTLNEEKYLGAALESIAKQNYYGTFEIIIVDGKSTDKTISIAKKYTKKILTTEPGKISHARQFGCDRAKGEIIVSCGADVVYDPNWLRKLIDPIVGGDAIATCGKIMPLDGSKIEDIFADKILHPIAGISHKIRIPFAAADNIAVNTQVFREVGGFDTNLVTAEDTELVTRLMKIGTVFYVEDAIAKISMRRIRAWGYSKYLSFHTRNFIKFHLKKNVEEEYEPVR